MDSNEKIDNDSMQDLKELFNNLFIGELTKKIEEESDKIKSISTKLDEQKKIIDGVVSDVSDEIDKKFSDYIESIEEKIKDSKNESNEKNDIMNKLKKIEESIEKLPGTLEDMITMTELTSEDDVFKIIKDKVQALQKSQKHNNEELISKMDSIEKHTCDDFKSCIAVINQNIEKNISIIQKGIFINRIAMCITGSLSLMAIILIICTMF